MCMRASSWIICLASVLAFLGCKTSEKKEVQNPNSSVSGLFKGGAAIIPTPSEIKAGYIPPKNVTSKPSRMPVTDGGGIYGLTERAQTTSGIEGIQLQCYNRSNQAIGKDWFLYAELYSDGKLIKDYTAKEMAGCDSMQVTLKNIDRKKKYKVFAQIYYRSPDLKQTIVFYQGETVEFEPSDVDVELKLAKLQMDQKVNIQIERTPKEVCEQIQKYFWNGKRCTNEGHNLVFPHSDFSDYYKSAKEDLGARVQSCLQVEEGNNSALFKCKWKSANQTFIVKLHGTKVAASGSVQSKKSWYTIQTLQPKSSAQASTPKCLTVSHTSAAATYPGVTLKECFAEGDASTNIDANQLFRLEPVVSGTDAGLANSFLVINEEVNTDTPTCLSVPPNKTDRSGAAPINDNASVFMAPCASSSADEDTRQTQFIRFMQMND